MAEHYHANAQVIGWQIDNEFGDRCYAPGTRKAFQGWLKDRYGSLDALNECWGTRYTVAQKLRIVEEHLMKRDENSCESAYS